MGDLMHALPAITEAKDQIPNIIFDWVVDKNFSSVPNWHPAVNKIIETNHRQWKVNPFSAQSRDEIKRVIKTINDEDYDLIIDMQNNLKSAFISLLCKKSDRNGCEKFQRISRTFGIQKKGVYFKKITCN